MSGPRPTIYTLGHSTRPVEETIAWLRSLGVRRLVDVRAFPASRRNPQYARDALARALEAAGIAYEHRRGLGGFRKPRPSSPNTAWKNAAFRGYADYMESDAFREELRGLEARAAEAPTAILCAESVPWRCHRSLVADALVARGAEVLHILGEGDARPHELTPFARVDGERLVYDGPVRRRRAEPPPAR